MVEPISLGELLSRIATNPDEEAFLSEYAGGFLLIRARGASPVAVHLKAEEGFQLTIGSDEDEVDLAFEHDQTLDPLHATISFHPGFRGWNLEDNETSFGTHVDEERVQKGRAHLLQDRQVIRPGGGLVELQFYPAEALWARMKQAGVTRTKIKRPPSAKKQRRPQPDG